MVRFLFLDLLAPAALGGLATLGFAPFNYYPLTIIAVAGLLGLWWQASAGRSAWRGFVYGGAHFATGVYWVYVSTHVYGGAPVWAGVVAAVLLSVYLALYPALVGCFAGLTRGWPRLLWALLWVPAAWVLAELVRSWAIGGFPWLSLGYAMTDAPVTPLAPIGGVYFISFWVMVAAASLVLLFAGSLLSRLVAVVLIGLAPVALWALPAEASWTHPAGKPLSVAIIQGNVSQDQKWQPDQFSAILQRYQSMTRHSHAELVVWPEVAIPATADQVSIFLSYMNAIAAERDQTILAGVLDVNPAHDGVYNSIQALGVGSGQYDKRHLVPFGEYFPVPDLIKRLFVALGIPVSKIDFGAAQQPLIHSHGVAIGSSICFEDAFGYEIAKSLPQAGVLVNVTNDAWFAGTTAANLHLQIARMRALEAGRPMIRAANTGISAFIGYTGRIRSQTTQFKTTRLRAQVVPRAGLTPYMRHGDYALWWGSAGLTLLGLLGVLINRLRARRGRQVESRRRELMRRV